MCSFTNAFEFCQYRRNQGALREGAMAFSDYYLGCLVHKIHHCASGNEQKAVYIPSSAAILQFIPPSLVTFAQATDIC